MAALHAALQALYPTSFSSISSQDDSQLKSYLEDAFLKCQIIIDSVPPPPIPDTIPIPTRSRSSTSSSIASSLSEISGSSARPEPPPPSLAQLMKEWGKPYKLSAKENPMGMGVYKLASKDGRGAWFARRSIHEGLPFSQWKAGLQSEFPESAAVDGGPGAGNIRGIGGERLVERKVVDGVGTAEVYHLSAQFPGPTTPRDFVTLLLTSSSALPEPPHVADDEKTHQRHFTEYPRHYMVISKPCQHSDCPPRDGFIRGEYESVEFIREIPKKPRKSASTTDLSFAGLHRATSSGLEREAILRNAMQKSTSAEALPRTSDETKSHQESQGSGDLDHLSPKSANKMVSEGRTRGKTISFAGSRGMTAKGEAMDVPGIELNDEELNPVEWIMITRSDPGGSVPRFMVERGTPAGIVSDAGKFLDWACKKAHKSRAGEVDLEPYDPERQKEALENDKSLEAYQTNGRLAGLGEEGEDQQGLEALETNGHLAGRDATTGNSVPRAEAQKENIPPPKPVQQDGILFNITNAAYSTLEAYAPKAITDRLPDRPSTPTSPKIISPPNEIADSSPETPKRDADASSISSTDSDASFASASEGKDSITSSKSNPSLATNSSFPTSISATNTASLSNHEKAIAALAIRKQKLDEKLAKTRDREQKDKEDLTSKETARIKKAEEKHAKEVAKAEDRHTKELAKLEAQRQRDAAKEEDRKKKLEEKDERTRFVRELDGLKEQLGVVKGERDLLRDQVGGLQKENTALVARVGRMDGGEKILKEVKDDMGKGS